MILSSTDTEDKRPELEVGDVITDKDTFYMVVQNYDSYGLLELGSGYIQVLPLGGIKTFVDSLSKLSGLLGSYEKVSGNFNAYIGE